MLAIGCAENVHTDILVQPKVGECYGYVNIALGWKEYWKKN
jgi:hypothetical protein